MTIYQARLNSGRGNPSAINAPEQNQRFWYYGQSITENVYLSNVSANARPISKQQKAPHEFEYVPRKEYMPVRRELEKVIHQLQDEVRDRFTFQKRFIGSSSRNMITRDKKGNCGYDFDVDIILNRTELGADEINDSLQKGLNKIVKPFGYDFSENSTRVLTIKVKDRAHSRILYSCDFAIKREWQGGWQYIHFNKKQNKCSWQWLENKPIESFREKEEALRSPRLWGIVRKRYLEYKNSPENAGRKSRVIYRMTINDVYNEYVLQGK